MVELGAVSPCPVLPAEDPTPIIHRDGLSKFLSLTLGEGKPHCIPAVGLSLVINNPAGAQRSGEHSI